MYETNRDRIQSVTNYWGGTDPEDIASKYGYIDDSLARTHADAKPSAWHPALPGAWGWGASGSGYCGANPNLPPITLQRLGWRWYQADSGRFVQRDPIGLGGGTNTQGYAAQNPLILVDPDGREVITVGVVTVLVGTGVYQVIKWIHDSIWGGWAGGRIAEDERRMRRRDPSIRPSLHGIGPCINGLLQTPGTTFTGPPFPAGPTLGDPPPIGPKPPGGPPIGWRPPYSNWPGNDYWGP